MSAKLQSPKQKGNEFAMRRYVFVFLVAFQLKENKLIKNITREQTHISAPQSQPKKKTNSDTHIHHRSKTSSYEAPSVW